MSEANYYVGLLTETFESMYYTDIVLLVIFSERELLFRPSVVCNIRARFGHPSVDIQVKFYGDRPRGPLRRGS